MPTAAHPTLTLSELALLTPHELRDYRAICRRFITEHGRSGWAYARELELLFAINHRLDYLGDIELDEA